MKKLFLTVSIFSLACAGLFAQKSVTPVKVDSGATYGQNYIFYALPQTAFLVDATVVKVHEYQGIYYEYAEKLLGLSQANAISKDHVIYSLKSIELKPVSVPDENFVYAVELSGKQVKNGMYNDALLQNATRGMNQPASTLPASHVNIPDFYRYYSNLSWVEQESPYVETQIVDGVVRQVPAVHTEKVAKSNEQKAQEAAAMIEKIRDDRYALLAGTQEVAYSAETIEKMVAELNTLEKNYLSLFMGYTVEEEVHYTSLVIPDTTDALIPMFSLSTTGGFSEQLSPKPMENYYLMVQLESEPAAIPEFISAWHCAKGYKANTGYRLRSAMPAQVDVIQGNKSVVTHTGRQYLYQFGQIETLPKGLDTLDISKFAIIY